ncbi:hypothetical protein ACFL5Q_04200 [Planctomycetota bacterium]
MTGREEQIYELLPAVHRLRDAELGYVLQALLGVVQEQAEAVGEDIDQLYENWFIETCQQWAVPYVGDLVGLGRDVVSYAPAHFDESKRRRRNRFLYPRREVANAVAFRRRKGTLSVLEELADDVAGWPARAVELYRLVTQFQSVHHPDPCLGRTVDVRDRDELDRIDGPFDSTAHTVDVRRLRSVGLAGRYNLPHVGLFVWRLPTYSLDRTNARCYRHLPCDKTVRLTVYTFDPLKKPTQLYIRPEKESRPTDIASEWNVPARLRREALENPCEGEGGASRRYYGPEKSLAVWIPCFPDTSDDGLVPARNVIPMDLSPWVGPCCSKKSPDKGCEAGCTKEKPNGLLDDLCRALGDSKIAVDPEQGLLAVKGEEREIRVRYHYAFSDEMGGGEYPRRLSQDYSERTHRVRIRQAESSAKGEPEPASDDLIDTSLKTLQVPVPVEELKESSGVSAPGAPRRLAHDHTILEITDSSLYELDESDVYLDTDQTLEIRAASGFRPVIKLDGADCRPGLRFLMAAGGTLILDGVVFTGGAIQVDSWAGTPPTAKRGRCESREPSRDEADVQTTRKRRLVIRHCTLVPEEACCQSGGLELGLAGECVTIEDSIVGRIRQTPTEQVDCRSKDEKNDQGQDPAGGPVPAKGSIERPTLLSISDSIVDGGCEDRCAIHGTTRFVLHVERSTVFGKVEVREIELAQDSIFTGKLCVVRRQTGGMRFCYVPACCKTPRRYYCQPDLLNQEAKPCSEDADPPREGADKSLKTKPCDCARASDDDSARREIEPRFTSVTYGDAGYGQLAHDCPIEIVRGAEDESEMGAFHDLYQPQRDANLRARLEEFTPVSMKAAIVYAS